MRVAFAGLGVMGYPMAGFLAGAGHETPEGLGSAARHPHT
ncbi:MAG: NAD(P)-dependent oxidoreductase, partial [Proteobacteria bacterium]|nr:NAD(P)-dependent oxidoreductase [Pseudomonadota bacterium]